MSPLKLAAVLIGAATLYNSATTEQALAGYPSAYRNAPPKLVPQWKFKKVPYATYITRYTQCGKAYRERVIRYRIQKVRVWVPAPQYAPPQRFQPPQNIPPQNLPPQVPQAPPRQIPV